MDLHSTFESSSDDHGINFTLDESDTEPNEPKYLFTNLGNRGYNIMVDTGSIVCLVTKRIAREIDEADSNAWWRPTTNRTHLKPFNNTPIKSLGTLHCDV